jgi:hypothetical protein
MSPTAAQSEAARWNDDAQVREALVHASDGFVAPGMPGQLATAGNS